MKKILIPIDYSEASNSAAHYGLSLAKDINCEVVLFHALQVPVPSGEIPPVYFTGPDLEITEKKKLRGYSDDLKLQYPDVKITSEVRYDFVKDGIAELANSPSGNYRLVIMGISPAGSLIQMFPGGTAVNLINDIKIPVLIVPHAATYTPVKTIIAGIDPESSDISSALRTLRNFMILTNSEIRITHVQLNNELSKEEILTRLEKKVSTAFKGLNVSYSVIAGDDLYKSLNLEARQNKSAILAMLHHKRGFFGALFSTEHTRKLAYITDAAMLVIPVD